MRWTECAATSALLTALLPGCAPVASIEAVQPLTRTHEVNDLRNQRVEHLPCLRFDSGTIHALETAAEREDLASARDDVLAALTIAREEALVTSETEFDRLPPAGWGELSRRWYGTLEAAHDREARSRVERAFRLGTDLRYEELVRTFESYDTLAALQSGVDDLLERVEPSVKETGRLGRALSLGLFSGPSALVVAIIHGKEYVGPTDRPFGAADRYDPQPVSPAAPDSTWALLQRHAPSIVQERVDGAPYADTVDQIGTVRADVDGTVFVDPDEASVYGYARQVMIDGAWRTQLVYTWWYPEHPKLHEPFDPEAGKIEGVLLRITLDGNNEPALYETAYACGCHHRVYPTERVEEAAREEFGSLDEGKRHWTERAVTARIDIVVPKIVGDGDPDAPTVVRTAAGYHALLDVAQGDGPHADEPRLPRDYRLRSYVELERLQRPDGTVVSMFDHNGLVRGARRAEGAFFLPLGMLYAGQPRQRGTQLIHWDHWDFDDPAIFERGLRLPRGF